MARAIVRYFRTLTAFPTVSALYRLSDDTSIRSWVHLFLPLVDRFADISRAGLLAGWLKGWLKGLLAGSFATTLVEYLISSTYRRLSRRHALRLACWLAR